MNEMRVAELRRLRGWTQERLAEASGIAVRTIQRIERGSDASLESLSSIARALEVPVRDLFTADDASGESLEAGVRGLGDRMETQQAQRDGYSRGWRYLYIGVGLLVTFATIAIVGTRPANELAIFLIPAYWAGGLFLSRFLMSTVIDPWLDRRYPLSRPRHPPR